MYKDDIFVNSDLHYTVYKKARWINFCIAKKQTKEGNAFRSRQVRNRTIETRGKLKKKQKNKTKRKTPTNKDGDKYSPAPAHHF